MLTEAPRVLLCYYQSAFYRINRFEEAVDVATTDNMVVIVDRDGSAWIMEFNADKIITGEVTPSRIGVGETV
jgi:hypothetical protein